MRTWLHDFWIPYTRTRQLQLRVVHTGTRPTHASNAYRPLPTVETLSITCVPGIPVPGSGARLPRATDLARAIANSDVLYFDNGYVFQDEVALRAARIAGVRTISGHHSVILHAGTGPAALVHNIAWNSVGKRLLRRFDSVHALNGTDAAYLRSAGGRDVRIVPLPVDRHTFFPGEKREPFTVLFVGRLHPQKGIDRLARIARSLLGEDRHLEIRIVGAGPQEDVVAPLTKDPRVRLLHRLERPQVAAEMRAAHVLLAPSRSETFGFVAAEALASGTPVICTPTNGFLDLVNSANGAILSEPDDTGAWIREIERVRSLTPKNYADLSMHAKTSVERLGFESVSAEMDNMLRLPRSEVKR